MSDANIVGKYHEAWTHRDMDSARSCLADNIDFQGPIDTFTTADEFIATLTGFAQMLTRVDLLHELYDNDAAALLYDCVTNSRPALPERPSSSAWATERSQPFASCSMPPRCGRL